jgi:nucleoside-diphosphate-sugar epimerase
MKVLVTGASGRVGAATVREFLEHGYDVRALDKMALPAELRPGKIKEEWRDRLEMVYADLTDRLTLLKAAEGCDSIAHLAAVPNPSRSEERLTEINVLGTQHILAAAEANGIQKVALASSNCVFGFVFALHPIQPEYLPIDDNHPCKPQDLYGLSKVLNEETAAAYTRRCGMTTVCLRLTTVMGFEDGHNHWKRRQLERGGDHASREFWTYVDVRDSARAFRLSVEQAKPGHHRLLIAARDSFAAHDIRELVRRHYPERAAEVEHLHAHDSLYVTTPAEEQIGWVSQHSWRDVEAFKNLDVQPLHN